MKENFSANTLRVRSILQPSFVCYDSKRLTHAFVGQISTVVALPDAVRGSPPRAWDRSSPLETRCYRAAVHPHVRGADVSWTHEGAFGGFLTT